MATDGDGGKLNESHSTVGQQHWPTKQHNSSSSSSSSSMQINWSSLSGGQCLKEAPNGLQTHTQCVQINSPARKLERKKESASGIVCACACYRSPS